MKPHKRNGRAAKSRRQETAKNHKPQPSQKASRQQKEKQKKGQTPEERLLTKIFGKPDEASA